MRKLLAILIFLPGSLLASGNQVGLVVSSGTYQSISTYANDDGANRQAIVLGDFSSSSTLRVDGLRGIPVYLSTTGASNIGTATVTGSTVGVVSAAPLTVVSTGIPVTGTFWQATQPVSGNVSVILSTIGVVYGGAPLTVVSTGIPVTGTFFQGTQPVSIASPVTVVSTGIPVTGTFFQGTQPVSIASAVTVTGSTVGVVGAVAATQSGTWTVVQTTSGVNASTIGVVNAPGTTLAVTGSFSASATEASTGTINGTVPPVATLVGAQGVTGNLSSFRVDSSSYLYVNVAAGGAAGGTSSNFGSAFPTPGTAAGFTNGTNMQAARVDASSAVFITHNGIAQPVTSTYTTVVSTGIPVVNGGSTFNAIVTGSTVGVVGVGNFNVTGSTIGIISPAGTYLLTAEEAVVSSTALSGVQTQGSSMTIRVDSIGRTITADIPAAVIVSTYSANIAPGTTEVILVSSPTAPNRTYLCGCIFMNTSATNTGATIYQTNSNIAANPFFPIGIPANYVPSGVRNDCGHPFFWGDPGEQLTIKPSATAASVSMNCTYFQSQ